MKKKLSTLLIRLVFATGILLTVWGGGTGNLTVSAAPASETAGATAQADTVVGEDGAGLKILVSSMSMADPFHSWLANATVNYIKTAYPAATYKLIDLQKDGANIQPLVDQAVLESFNALILDKITGEQNTDDMLREARENGVFTVVTNDEDTDDGVSSTSGASHYGLGYTVGLRAAELLPENAKVLVILSTPSDAASDSRWQGYQDAFSEKGRDDIEVLDIKNCDGWAKERAMAIMDDWMQLYDDVDAVLGMNDGMVLGCIEAAKADGRDVQAMQFYGIDGLGDACLSIEAGELTASVLQDAVDMGENAVRLSVAMINGEITTPEHYSIQPITVDSENVQEIIDLHKENGFL